jgi:signal transduction histidine kinase
MPNKPTLLIVDDEERNIRLLKAMLMAKNYNLLEASRGEEALRIVSETPPDMILLDVMMPRMDGFEVCRRLKQDEKNRKIPVIMITALSEKQHRVKAMEVGADDFLSKPVDLTELTVRVKSLLRIKSYHDELFNSYQEIAAKNEKLEELQKVKEGLTHMIIHDLRNPLTAISTYLQLAVMESSNPTQSQHPKISRCLHFCAELDRLIQNLLDINKMEEKRMQLQLEKTNLETLINDVSDHFRADAEERAISLGFFKEEQIPSIPIDPGLMKRVFANLLNNALRHTPKDGRIQITVDFTPDKKHLLVAVRDNGLGLIPEYHQKIFDKFEQVRLKSEKSAVGSGGLGLTFCKMAVEAHGGKIWIESEGEGKGCTFFVSIPIEPIPQNK